MLATSRRFGDANFFVQQLHSWLEYQNRKPHGEYLYVTYKFGNSQKNTMAISLTNIQIEALNSMLISAHKEQSIENNSK